MGAKRARDRLGLETCLEESVAEEVNVACGAVVPQLEPTGEASRRVTQPAGSSVWGSSGVSDQDMATPIASTEGALSFGECRQVQAFSLENVCFRDPGWVTSSFAEWPRFYCSLQRWPA